MRTLILALLLALPASQAQAKPSARALKIAGAASLAVGTLGTLVGIGVLVHGEERPSGALFCVIGDCGTVLTEQARMEVTGGAASLAIGAALVATGATLVGLGYARERRLTLAPSVSPLGGGASLMLRF